MIEARGLTKRYSATLAVDHLTFDVVPGTVTGFLGPNGSGKSTTMRMIMGIDTPTTGTVLVNGRPFGELAWPLREVGALLEAKAFHPGRSARDHLLALAQTNAISRSRVDDVIDLVGLSSVAGKRAGTYSLGMGQRLGVAAALLGDPEILLFDEPTNGLDPDGVLWIRNLLKELAEEGRTVFVSSHLMSEMAITAEHLVVIGRGRLIADASTTDFIASNSEQYVRVRTPAEPYLRRVLEDAGASVTRRDEALSVVGMTVETVGELAGANHIVVHELSPQSASLEDAFMELTRDALDYRGGTQSAPKPVRTA
jgi:ABC-2 type transport system ATP-binding protein